MVEGRGYRSEHTWDHILGSPLTSSLNLCRTPDISYLSFFICQKEIIKFPSMDGGKNWDRRCGNAPDVVYQLMCHWLSCKQHTPRNSLLHVIENPESGLQGYFNLVTQLGYHGPSRFWPHPRWSPFLLARQMLWLHRIACFISVRKRREKVSSFIMGQKSRSSLDEAVFGHVLWSLEPVAYEMPSVDWFSLHWVSIFGPFTVAKEMK